MLFLSAGVGGASATGVVGHTTIVDRGGGNGASGASGVGSDGPDACIVSDEGGGGAGAAGEAVAQAVSSENEDDKIMRVRKLKIVVACLSPLLFVLVLVPA